MRTRLLSLFIASVSIITMITSSVSVYAAIPPQPNRGYGNAPEPTLRSLGIYFMSDTGMCATTPTAVNGVSAGGGNGSGGSGGDVTKYPHIKTAFQFFMQAGFTPEQSAGIVGNLMQESGWSIDPLNTDGVAHGIAQWQGGRLQPMYTWVTAWSMTHDQSGLSGVDPAGENSFMGQLNFIIHDLNTSYIGVRNTIKTMSTTEEVANYWNHNYEISADTSNNRPHNAELVLAAAQANGWENGITVVGPTAGTDTTPNGCSGASASSSPDCTAAAGDAKILCEAKRYVSIFYLWGGGPHGAGEYTNFKAKCSAATLAPPNDPAYQTGKTFSQAANASNTNNPGACATDCSGLVSVAVDGAFGLNYGWTVNGIENDSHWQRISISAAQPGDVVTVGSNEHVEIVDHVTGGTIYTFGSHYTGSRTGPSSAGMGYYDAAWHWTGPGSSGIQA